MRNIDTTGYRRCSPSILRGTGLEIISVAGKHRKYDCVHLGCLQHVMDESALGGRTTSCCLFQNIIVTGREMSS